MNTFSRNFFVLGFFLFSFLFIHYINKKINYIKHYKTPNNYYETTYENLRVFFN